MQQTTTAFVFPGQGSQHVGMGRELAETYRVARQTFLEANDVLGFDLAALCFDGPADDLTDTINAQPALYTAGVAALRTLYEALDDRFQPACVAGHSLGELTALTAAGVMSFPDGLQLVRRRGELMQQADQHSPGGMTALLGADLDQVEAICAQAREETGDIVVIANDNCPGQVVIAGGEEALECAMTLAQAAGIKRVMRLPVSIAAHSPLMARVQAAFQEAVDSTPFHPPAVPVVGNVEAAPLTSIEAVRADLGAQLTSPVRWTESVQHMIGTGITDFVELGSGSVLAGLLKRIDRGVKGHVVDSPEGIEAVAEALRTG